MSRSLGNQLPEPLRQLFDGQRLEQKTGLAIILHTVDGKGHPHPAILSPGEILARGDSKLRLALYANSSTSNNLRRGGALSLALAEGGLAYYVKGTAHEIAGPIESLPGQAAFDVNVDEVLEDGDPSAQVTSGFTLKLTQAPADTLALWKERVGALATLP